MPINDKPSYFISSVFVPTRIDDPIISKKDPDKYNCNAQYIFLLVFLFLCNITQGQSPFNHGRTKNIYFISKSEIRKNNIEHIYTTVSSGDCGPWSFFDIDFTNISNTFYNKFNLRSDDSSAIPSIDSLIMKAGENHIHASYYSFANNKVEQVGMDGTGVLCNWVYLFHKGYSIADETCQFGNTSRQKKVSYLPIGLVNYIACCKVEDFNGRLTGKRKVIFTDTTYYIYDKEKRILGYKKERKQPKYIPVFNNLKRLYFYSQVQSYINKVEFENYIDSLIGYRPKLILFEIYRNAVLPFQYDNDKMKYFEMADIHLE